MDFCYFFFLGGGGLLDFVKFWNNFRILNSWDILDFYIFFFYIFLGGFFFNVFMVTTKSY